MADKKLIKKTLDIPEDIFELIMDFAHREKLYKFTPAVLMLLKKGLETE
jgi:hypothetical protein